MFLVMSEPVPNPKQILYIRPKYTLKLSVACPQQQKNLLHPPLEKLNFEFDDDTFTCSISQSNIL